MIEGEFLNWIGSKVENILVRWNGNNNGIWTDWEHYVIYGDINQTFNLLKHKR